MLFGRIADDAAVLGGEARAAAHVVIFRPRHKPQKALGVKHDAAVILEKIAHLARRLAVDHEIHIAGEILMGPGSRRDCEQNARHNHAGRDN